MPRAFCIKICWRYIKWSLLLLLINNIYLFSPFTFTPLVNSLDDDILVVDFHMSDESWLAGILSLTVATSKLSACIVTFTNMPAQITCGETYSFWNDYVYWIGGCCSLEIKLVGLLADRVWVCIPPAAHVIFHWARKCCTCTRTSY